MSNQKILEKAIRKAEKHGWHEQKWLGGLYEKEPNVYLPIYGIIFSRDFAKALWGEGYPRLRATVGFNDNPPTDPKRANLPLWAQHLQSMVIADDPIKYLGEHIDG